MNSAVSDPNFPLVQLPAAYESHRTTNRATLEEGEEYNLIDVDGPGCVRHFWITPSDPKGLDLASLTTPNRELGTAPRHMQTQGCHCAL